MTDKTKPIIIGADQNGWKMKNVLRDYLQEKGFTVTDIGVNSDDPVLYPDIALELSNAIQKGDFERGILICGTGAGMAITANKVPGVRAVCVHDPYTAERARASNNAQVITFGSQIIGSDVAKKLVDIWLESEFQGGRSQGKVERINQIDAENHKIR
jgi:ribose 5-phosphate isomerase B